MMYSYAHTLSDLNARGLTSFVPDRYGSTRPARHEERSTRKAVRSRSRVFIDGTSDSTPRVSPLETYGHSIQNDLFYGSPSKPRIRLPIPSEGSMLRESNRRRLTDQTAIWSPQPSRSAKVDNAVLSHHTIESAALQESPEIISSSAARASASVSDPLRSPALHDALISSEDAALQESATEHSNVQSPVPIVATSHAISHPVNSSSEDVALQKLHPHHAVQEPFATASFPPSPPATIASPISLTTTTAKAVSDTFTQTSPLSELPSGTTSRNDAKEPCQTQTDASDGDKDRNSEDITDAVCSIAAQTQRSLDEFDPACNEKEPCSETRPESFATCAEDFLVNQPAGLTEDSTDEKEYRSSFDSYTIGNSSRSSRTTTTTVDEDVQSKTEFNPPSCPRFRSGLAMHPPVVTARSSSRHGTKLLEQQARSRPSTSADKSRHRESRPSTAEAIPYPRATVPRTQSYDSAMPPPISFHRNDLPQQRSRRLSKSRPPKNPGARFFRSPKSIIASVVNASSHDLGRRPVVEQRPPLLPKISTLSALTLSRPMSSDQRSDYFGRGFAFSGGTTVTTVTSPAQEEPMAECLRTRKATAHLRNPFDSRAELGTRSQTDLPSPFSYSTCLTASPPRPSWDWQRGDV